MSARRQLVERETVLSQLHVALARAREGHGEVALVGGEAGAGKTSVIREFVRHAAGPPTVMWGACDPLSAPRPFGPLIDAVGSIDAGAAQQLASGATRSESFAASLALVDGSRAAGAVSVFVIEDAHWADEGTLDMLAFLGRRIADFPTLIVISYRDDEVGGNHPLRVRFGELAPAIRCRIRLQPLSLTAVTELVAGSGLDAEDVHRMTNGNAFFVTEVVRSGSDPLPESIRDAVTARASRLPAGARLVVDALSVVPGRVDRWLLDLIVESFDVEPDLEPCIESGLLRYDTTGALEFNHELARLAVSEALSDVQRREHHARVLAALLESDLGRSDSARLAFHAAAVGDAALVVEHSPLAAARASALGTHREAALHLANALSYGDRLPSVDRAELLSRYGAELVMIGQVQDAVDAFDEAAEIQAANDDPESQALALVMTNRPLVLSGRQVEADAWIERATILLGGRPPSRAAAMLATCESSNHMLARRFDETERLGQHAISLAEAVGAADVLAEVSIQSGIALAMSGDDAGLTRIRRGIALAEETGNDYLVALGHSQIGSGYGEMRMYQVAVEALRDGIAFAEAREFGSSHYMRAWLGRCELELGHWDSAGTIAIDLIRNPRCVGISRFVALVTLGWLRCRRGDPDARSLLDEALSMARSMHHLQRLWPIAVCRAELAWLADALDTEIELVDEAAALAAELDYRPAIEELAHWQHLADGVTRGSIEHARTPFGLSAAGRPDLAAARWAEIGCPYEAAVARYLTGSPAEVRLAYEAFHELGAAPMRARSTAALRAVGQAVPRGPRATTRNNPHMLTDRELDVLGLLTAGSTNREIADGLDISVKTADHHVSSVLAKLGVRSRGEAAVAAIRLGIITTNRSENK